MKTNNIWVLIAKMLTNDASNEELAEINRAAMADPELDFTIKMLLRLWNNTPIKREHSIVDKLVKCIIPHNKKQ